ncbi:DUF3078 domain-containing protein [Kordia algicida OT-1]|uniref:DUF3078 domain-containing protein n=1 Tax=Kordia algicida OT-1 TaxID=391587 RepID=A9DNL0_9FLAO|nr:DUF3078 domain-containing protein [Kordia algicida]EDP97217.1 hypothetical protein KAOT1_18682 [Kordia algicida OT-1]
MKHALTLCLLCISTLVTAQGVKNMTAIKAALQKSATIKKPKTPVKDTIPKGWRSNGKVSFLFNQAAFSNWAAGGENSISGTLGLNYDLHYHQEEWDWDTRVLVAYGLTQTRNSEFTRKTDDRFELNSVIGKKGQNHWFYSGFLNFRTQMTSGFRFDTDENGKEIRMKNTDAFSPAYLSFGPGVLWKKHADLKFNIAPGTSKVTIVDDDFTLPNEEYFGVPEGESIRYEIGMYASGYYKFTLFDNIVMENILNLYSNYLENPENIDVDYNINLVMTINKYLSTNINFQTIYDDNAFKGFQTREVLGLGVNYGF